MKPLPLATCTVASHQESGRAASSVTGMPHHVRGVVARAKGEPVSIETIIVPDPGPGEALVTIQACGVCHTDLHYREGTPGSDRTRRAS